MNHLVFENFAQSRVAVASSHAAHFMRCALFKGVQQKRNRKRDDARLHANIARRARQAATPTNFARGQNAVEIFGVELRVKLRGVRSEGDGRNITKRFNASSIYINL